VELRPWSQQVHTAYAAGKTVWWDDYDGSWRASVAAPPRPPEPPSDCPRCSGRVVPDARDDDASCLNCGWVQPPARLAEPLSDGELAPRPGKLRRRQPTHGGLRL